MVTDGVNFCKQRLEALEHVTRWVVQTRLIANLVFVYVEIVRLAFEIANVS